MFDFYNLLFKAEKSIIDAKTMNSIQNECTELKHKYDACYTVWFTDRFLKGDTNDEMCAPFFAMYQQCLKACRTLKEEYDACFNFWFAEKFLKGDENDSMCAELLKSYRECVQKAMKEHNIHIKEIDSDRFEIEKDDVKSPTEGK